jgi:hypothetical protein
MTWSDDAHLSERGVLLTIAREARREGANDDAGWFIVDRPVCYRA